MNKLTNLSTMAERHKTAQQYAMILTNQPLIFFLPHLDSRRTVLWCDTSISTGEDCSQGSPSTCIGTLPFNMVIYQINNNKLKALQALLDMTAEVESWNRHNFETFKKTNQYQS